MTPLPIDGALDDVVRALRESQNLVLQAAPGAGKTTRVPRALLDAGFARDGEIVVLQPRRIAARLAARRVAEELGESEGGTVGYQIRFEERVSARTRIRFVTEGLLTRRMLGDSGLAGISTVVLDEFHERHLHADLALAFLTQLQRTERPDLRLIVMSATLDAEPIARHLSAPSIRVEGRMFDVATSYIERPDERPLSAQVVSAVQRMVAEGLDGDVLVFLPGAGEIRRASEAVETLARRENLLAVPLHGDLPVADQERAIRPADRRKIILSTNVAETSVTIDGVVAVIDSGLARIAVHQPWSGIPALKVGRVSRASCIQRTGRAGRTRPGRCVRLFTLHDYQTRLEHDVAEIHRYDLAEMTLQLRCAGVGDALDLPWLESPRAPAVQAARQLLVKLEALDGEGAVTELGRRMARFPAHPRQARIVVEGERRGVARDACAMAALVAERDVLATARVSIGTGRVRSPTASGSSHVERGTSDIVDRLERLDDVRSAGLDPASAARNGLDFGSARTADRAASQLERWARTDAAAPNDPESYDRALRIALLAGYPDRVARRRPSAPREADRAEVVLAGGGSARLAATSVVRDAEWLIAIDAEVRSDGKGSATWVALASAIDPDWLIELWADRVADTVDVEWHAESESVRAFRRLRYDGLVIDEHRTHDADPGRVAAVLAHAAIERGIHAFGADGEIERLLQRIAFARSVNEKGGFPSLAASDLEAFVARACVGARSFDDLRGTRLADAIRGALTGDQLRRLATDAPDRIALPSGMSIRVEYPRDAAPFVASRLQDFFGMAEGPRVGERAQPLVLHLLAPNRRAVQITTDLAGFWRSHYPAIARELRRRYPKHSWPDDPLTSAPPAPRRGR